MLLRIIFSGLVSFASNGANGDLCGMLIDARSPFSFEHCVDWNEEAERCDRRQVVTIPSHLPVIRVRKDQLDCPPLATDCRQPDYEENGTGYVVFQLDGEELSLVSASLPDPPLKRVQGTRRALPATTKYQQPCCTDDASETCIGSGPALSCGAHAYLFEVQTRDFDWVLNFKDLGISPKLQDTCFDEAYSGVAVARMKLDRGRLLSYMLEGESSPSNIAAPAIALVTVENRLPNYPEYYMRSMAKYVAVELNLNPKPSSVEIHSRNLRTPKRIKPIRLVPGDSMSIEVHIENQPSSGYHKHHFAHHYRLLDSPPPMDLWRMPDLVVGVEGLLCPPSQGTP